MRADERTDDSLHRASIEGLDGAGSDMSRLISISDGVFAFSMTFLVIDLVLPQRLSSGLYPALPGYLGSQTGALIAYVLSFFIIAAWWSTHRRLFSSIVRYDSLLTRLNSIFLMIIAVTPFLVGILLDYGPGLSFGPQSANARLAVALYGAVEAFGGLVLLAVWRHATRDHRLVRPALPHTWIRATEQGALTNAVVFAISVPIAFVSPLVSMLLWIFVISGYHRIVRLRRTTTPSLPTE